MEEKFTVSHFEWNNTSNRTYQFIWCSSLRNYQMKLKVFFMIKSIGWVDITVHSLHFKKYLFFERSNYQTLDFCMAVTRKTVYFIPVVCHETDIYAWMAVCDKIPIAMNLQTFNEEAFLNRQFSSVCLIATGMHMFFRCDDDTLTIFNQNYF